MLTLIKHNSIGPKSDQNGGISNTQIKKRSQFSSPHISSQIWSKWRNLLEHSDKTEGDDFHHPTLPHKSDQNGGIPKSQIKYVTIFTTSPSLSHKSDQHGGIFSNSQIKKGDDFHHLILTHTSDQNGGISNSQKTKVTISPPK